MNNASSLTTNGDADPATNTNVNTVSVTNGATERISGRDDHGELACANSGLEMDSSGAATVVTLNNGASIQTTGAGATAVNERREHDAQRDRDHDCDQPACSTEGHLRRPVSTTATAWPPSRTPP